MIYRLATKLLPKRFVASYTSILQYSSIPVEPTRFIGFTFVFSLLFALFVGMYSSWFFNKNGLVIGIVLFFLIQAIIYFWLMLSADRKGKFVENVLPDALQLMASNLRAGFTTDRSILLSARPEFGPLQEELNYVGKEIATGKEITEALMGITERVRSHHLTRTIELLDSGIRSGGELASLLEESAKDLRSQQLMDKKIRSSVNMYVIFIFAAVGFAAPLLFGLSTYLVKVLITQIGAVAEGLDGTSTGQFPLSFSGVSITESFVFTYSLVSIISSAIMGSLIIGLISKGKEKDGIQFIPVLIGLGLVVFIVTRFLIGLLLGDLLG